MNHISKKAQNRKRYFDNIDKFIKSKPLWFRELMEIKPTKRFIGPKEIRGK